MYLIDFIKNTRLHINGVLNVSLILISRVNAFLVGLEMFSCKRSAPMLMTLKKRYYLIRQYFGYSCGDLDNAVM